MDAIVNMKTLTMMRRFAAGDMQKIGGYDFIPQKTRLLARDPAAAALPRSRPMTQGVRPDALSSLIDELARTGVHGLMALRHGRVVYEGYWRPYRADYATMLYSLSKSVTCMAVGLAVGEGLLRLDERIVDIFKEKLPLIRLSRINQVTVSHLLTMSSGINFNESGSALERDWVRAVLESDCAFAPGSKFFYNSINSYMLSAIVCKRAGMSLTQYLTPRLFGPMGIEPYWEVCPLGIEKGGWGLYLTLEDMAKLGQLMLNKGRWPVDGTLKQLLSEDWIGQATSCRIKGERAGNAFGYGYQIWMSPFEGAFQFNGAFGQYVIVCPKQDMVIAIISSARSIFSDSAVSDAIEKYLFGAGVLSDRPVRFKRRAHKRLVRKTAGLTASPGQIRPPQRVVFPRLFPRLFAHKISPHQAAAQKLIDGKSYTLDPSLCGILPLAIQTVHLNFTHGISKIRFDFDRSVCRITMREGEDGIVIAAGLDGIHRYGPVTVRGEPYMTAGAARWATDEFDRPKLIVYLTFIETPHMRIMTFLFDKDNIVLKFSEWPTAYDAAHMLIELVGGPGGRIEQLFFGAAEIDGIKMKIERFSEPGTRGILEKTGGSP